MDDRCFACGRKLGANPVRVDTRDGQTVFVGRECATLIAAAGDKGWQPPKGGPRLHPLTPSPTPTAPQEADALREALSELVALKDLKENMKFACPASHRADLADEYERRRPLAWAAARAALAQHQPATLRETK